MAREVETDEDAEAFDEAFGNVAGKPAAATPSVPHPRPSGKPASS